MPSSSLISDPSKYHLNAIDPPSRAKLVSGNDAVAIPVYWPGGGVLPIVTTTADRSDIYSFKLFDGDNVTSSGLYGVVGGQNFA